MKKGMWRVIAFWLCGVCSLAWSQSVPSLINYQGLLKDASGNALDGVVTLTFNFYDAETKGILLLSIEQTNIITGLRQGDCQV